MEFKVGDRVRLTGHAWSMMNPELRTGSTQTVNSIDEDGALEFVGHGDNWWDTSIYGWEVELNMDTPAEHFAKQGLSTFEQNVRRILEGVADTVVQKNQAYGDSALNPIRVFSKTDRMEQLYTRLDDKLSRVQKGHEYPGDDTIRDIIGYCTLVLIARESQ